MTPEAIKWLMYDLIRWKTSEADVIAILQDRGATYDDLARYIMERCR